MPDTETAAPLHPRLEWSPSVSRAWPVVRGTRVPAGWVAEQVARGRSWYAIVQGCPVLTDEDIRACVGHVNGLPAAAEGCGPRPAPVVTPAFLEAADIEASSVVTAGDRPLGLRMPMWGAADQPETPPRIVRVWCEPSPYAGQASFSPIRGWTPVAVKVPFGWGFGVEPGFPDQGVVLANLWNEWRTPAGVLEWAREGVDGFRLAADGEGG